MKVKYDPDADILLSLLKDVPPSTAISGPGGVIVRLGEHARCQHRQSKFS